MNKIFSIALILAFFTSCNAHAEDNLETRNEAAARYITTMDLDTQLDTIINNIANTLAAKASPPATPDQKKEFSIFARNAVDKAAYTKSVLDAMTNVYTTDELNALADFYSSPVGKSINQKAPKYGASMVGVTFPLMIKVLKAYKEDCSTKSNCMHFPEGNTTTTILPPDKRT